jgi:hypothetical protein
VAAFEAGDVDYTPIASNDASWIRYDATLGPQLRAVPSLDLTYLGFDTSRPPFDNVKVRRAFGAAVDWQRIVDSPGGGEIAADSMVPPGVHGGGERPRSTTRRRPTLLAEVTTQGAGFPDVAFGTGGDAQGIAQTQTGAVGSGSTENTAITASAGQRPARHVDARLDADYPPPTTSWCSSAATLRRALAVTGLRPARTILATRDPAQAQKAFERHRSSRPTSRPYRSRTATAGRCPERVLAGQNGLGILRPPAWRGQRRRDHAIGPSPPVVAAFLAAAV